MIDRRLDEAARLLRGIRAGNPRFEAELLLAHALGRPRVFLFTHPEHEPGAAERAAFDHLLGRRLSGEPLQYVLGTAAFRNLTLKVGPGVLIPRSETEVLVDIAWDALERGRRAGRWSLQGGGAQHRRVRSRSGEEELRPWVVDVGVGSGAILLALIDEGLRHERLSTGGLWFRPLGIDVSPVALRYTVENSGLNNLPCPLLVRGDLLSSFSCVDPPMPLAAIISNPPYVSTAEMAELPPEIREHEPPAALQGGPDGLQVIRGLLDQALAFIGRGALLCFEIGSMQAEQVREELRLRGLLERATIHPDLAGRPRVVLVEPRG
ncbi:MAG: HemK/PrmC family methyltransferase [Candidatus Eisenbacteria bacterium]